MDKCPFCQSSVQADLLRFGGSCPACFNEIPGEEAATDPGVAAAGAAPAAEEAPSSTSSGLLFATLGLAAVLGGVGFWAYSQKQDAAQLAAVQQGVDELFIVPAEDLDAELAEADRLANEEAEAEEQARLAAATRQRQTSSGGSAITAPSRLDAQSAGSIATAESPRQTSLMPSTTNPLDDDLIVAPTLIGATVVLTDPTEIYNMIKGVMDKYLPRMKRCYEQQLKLDTGLQGRWWLSFKVGTSGRPLGVSITGEGVSHAELESCLDKTAGEMTFQRIAAPQDIRYPLNFSR